MIIIAFGSGETLQACIDSLLGQSFPGFEVRIVDNGPNADDAVARLTGLDDRFEILRPHSNLGFAAGNNLAAQGAETRWLALLNPDALAAPDWLERLVGGAEAAGAQMAGSLQFWHGHEGLLDGSGDAYHISGIAWRGLRGRPASLAPPSGEIFSPCAAAAIYDRQLFERVGGFDERFFAYHEDVDLAFRMRLQGARALQIQEATVSHVASGAPGHASALAVRLGTRNRIWTFIKNMPGVMMWVFTPFHALAVLVSLLRDFRRGRGGAAIGGLVDALTGFRQLFRDRRRVQNQRTASMAELLKAMTFSPLPILRGAADVRPWRGDLTVRD